MIDPKYFKQAIAETNRDTSDYKVLEIQSMRRMGISANESMKCLDGSPIEEGEYIFMDLRILVPLPL